MKMRKVEEKMKTLNFIFAFPSFRLYFEREAAPLLLNKFLLLLHPFLFLSHSPSLNADKSSGQQFSNMRRR
jgi:hypothetical protein